MKENDIPDQVNSMILNTRKGKNKTYFGKKKNVDIYC